MSRHSPFNKSRQSGTALIVSLLLLLVLTVLGVVMMQTTRMQERMAGNTRDLNMAVQGAESGLRYGESVIASYPALPPDTYTIPCVVCANNLLPVALYDPAQFDWAHNAQPYGQAPGLNAASLAGGGGQKLLQDPQYTTEHVGFRRDDWSTGSGVTGLDYYQITSLSTGASGSANVVLQSTFGHRYR